MYDSENALSYRNPRYLQKKKKKVFAEIRRLFLAEIRNLNVFSGQKQQLFPLKNQHSNLDVGTPKSRTGEGDAHFKKKKTAGRQEINRGGKNKNRGGGGAMLFAPRWRRA